MRVKIEKNQKKDRYYLELLFAQPFLEAEVYGRRYW